MSKPFLPPLGWNIPIVDDNGRPTREFQQKWSRLARYTAGIPDASDAAAMSLLLDLISNDEGDILRRGSSAWNGLSSPGGTTKFLRADGTYAEPPQQTVDESEISLSDLLTNNVSTTRHGFAPKLPDDATKYLDGSGVWSTPAGSGGGGAWFWLTNTSPDDWGFSGSAHATKGQLVNSSVDVAVSGLMFVVTPDAIGDAYQASIVTLDSSQNVTAITQSEAWSAPSAGKQIVTFDVTVSLAAGQTYGVLLTLTSGTATSICRGYWPSETPFLAAPIVNGGFLTLDSVDVEVGAALSLDTATSAAATALNLSF